MDAKEVLTKLQAAMSRADRNLSKRSRSKARLVLTSGRTRALLAYSPSKNTIVLTSRENIRKVVSGAEPKGPLLQRLKKADATQDFIIALAPEAFPNLDKIIDTAKKDAPPLMVTYLDAAKTVRGGTATFNLTGPALLRVVLDAKDAGAADNLEDLLQQALRMASAGLMVAKQTMPKEMRATLGPVVKLAEQLVDGAKATKSGNQVTLDVKRPEILDTAGPWIVGAVATIHHGSPRRARRAPQMNNMIQISIAMLNYERGIGVFHPP